MRATRCFERDELLIRLKSWSLFSLIKCNTSSAVSSLCYPSGSIALATDSFFCFSAYPELITFSTLLNLPLIQLTRVLIIVSFSTSLCSLSKSISYYKPSFSDLSDLLYLEASIYTINWFRTLRLDTLLDFDPLFGLMVANPINLFKMTLRQTFSRTSLDSKSFYSN